MLTGSYSVTSGCILERLYFFSLLIVFDLALQLRNYSRLLFQKMIKFTSVMIGLILLSLLYLYSHLCAFIVCFFQIDLRYIKHMRNNYEGFYFHVNIMFQKEIRIIYQHTLTVSSWYHLSLRDSFLQIKILLAITVTSFFYSCNLVIFIRKFSSANVFDIFIFSSTKNK